MTFVSSRQRQEIIAEMETAGVEPSILARLKSPDLRAEYKARSRWKAFYQIAPMTYEVFVMLGWRRAELRSKVLCATTYRRRRDETRESLISSINEFKLEVLIDRPWTSALPSAAVEILQIQCGSMIDALTLLTSVVEVAPRVGWRDGVPRDLRVDFSEADAVTRMIWKM